MHIRLFYRYYTEYVCIECSVLRIGQCICKLPILQTPWLGVTESDIMRGRLPCRLRLRRLRISNGVMEVSAVNSMRRVTYCIVLYRVVYGVPSTESYTL